MINRQFDFDATEHATREDFVALLNEDLIREHQPVISYVVYSQVLQGSQYTSITDPLESHVAEEAAHADQIDDLDVTRRGDS